MCTVKRVADRTLCVRLSTPVKETPCNTATKTKLKLKDGKLSSAGAAPHLTAPAQSPHDPHHFPGTSLSSHLSQRIPIFHQSHSKYFMWFAHKDVFHRSHSPANSLSAWRVLRRICKRGESHCVQTVNGQRTWVFIWFMYRATAKAKGSRQKKRSFYGQADIKGLPPPPYGQGVVIFSKQVDIFWLILPFYKGGTWTNIFTFAYVFSTTPLGKSWKNGYFIVRLTIRPTPQPPLTKLKLILKKSNWRVS